MMMMNQLLFVLRLGFGILLYANRQAGRQTDRQLDKQTESHGGKFVKGLSKMYMRKKEKSFVIQCFRNRKINKLKAFSVAQLQQKDVKINIFKIF